MNGDCIFTHKGDLGDNYATITIAIGVQVIAHRVAYTMFKGKIPEGMVVDHLCGKKSCVNPLHLEAVTTEVNIQRSWDKVMERRKMGLA